MSRNILLFTVLASLAIFSGCRTHNSPQENLFTAKVHIEDSIIYSIPQVPRLCDNIKSEKKYINIGDCNLYCEIEGEGMPLVLVHGGPGGTHHCFHPSLSAAAKNFKLIYYDQRGCGLSDYNPGKGYSFEQSVDDLENLRKALHIEKWIVMGHSYGGGLAQYYTIRHPENVAGLILVGSVPMLNKPGLNKTDEYFFLNEQEKQKVEEITKLTMDGKLSYAQYFYNSEINGGWKRQNYLKPTSEQQSQLALYDIVFDKNITTDYESYTFDHVFDSCPIPTLLCEGKYDPLWAEEKDSMMIANHPNATFLLFEKSSHNIYRDETKHFLEEIVKWSESLKIDEPIKFMTGQEVLKCIFVVCRK
jgi:proline iminopeptidase